MIKVNGEEIKQEIMELIARSSYEIINEFTNISNVNKVNHRIILLFLLTFFTWVLNKSTGKHWSFIKITLKNSLMNLDSTSSFMLEESGISIVKFLFLYEGLFVLESVPSDVVFEVTIISWV